MIYSKIGRQYHKSTMWVFDNYVLESIRSENIRLKCCRSYILLKKRTSQLESVLHYNYATSVYLSGNLISMYYIRRCIILCGKCRVAILDQILIQYLLTYLL